MLGFWQYNREDGSWEFFSHRYDAFEFPPDMIKTILEICNFDDEIKEATERVAVNRTGPLLCLLRRRDGRVEKVKQRYMTMPDDQIVSAFAFAEQRDLFLLSDSGTYTAEMWGD